MTRPTIPRDGELWLLTIKTLAHLTSFLLSLQTFSGE